MPLSTVHIIWGEIAAAQYRRGVIDNLVRLAHAVYDFKTSEESLAFLLGIKESRKDHEWAHVTRLPDQRALGMPLRSRLIDAIFKGDPDVVEDMLDAGVNPDTKAPNGMTALQVAAQQGQDKIAEKLLTRGARVEEPESSQNAFSAVHLAAVSMKPNASKVLNLLADRDADLDRQDADGKTALVRAIEQNRLDHAKILVEKGAKLDTPDNNGLTARAVFDAKFGAVVGDAMIDSFNDTLTRAETIHENKMFRAQEVARHPFGRPPTPYDVHR